MSLRILFVEKDPTTADMLVPGLERKGHQVAVAHTHRRATSRSRTFRPDLLIMDVASFGAKGYDICDAVRVRLDGVATLLLLPEGHDAAGSTAEAFMTPPFTSRRLLYRVRKIADLIPCRDLRAGDLVLDPYRCFLRKGATAVRLRPKEAELLALFMRNRGKVVSRREIMEEIWETDYLEDTRTLNVHVCWLRAKIEDEPAAPCYLRTVRGVGYRFDVPDTNSDLARGQNAV